MRSQSIKSREDPNPYCPSCRVYVSNGDNAVVCGDCNAYIHYACDGINDEDIKALGNKDYTCKKHNL